MGNTNGRESLLSDGPDVRSTDDSFDTSTLVINQGTLARPRPQLLFHSAHGLNIRISKGGRLAKRVESFCKGLAFSDRPISIDENVCLRFTEIATNWSGVLRFGVTSIDPASLMPSLPKFACPDLTSKEGNWAKALAERYCQMGTILHFYLRENGELYYGINGVAKGLFLSGINTTSPLWVMVDIYGNTNSLEFVDPNEVRFRRSIRHSHELQTHATPAVVPHQEQSSPPADALATLSLSRTSNSRPPAPPPPPSLISTTCTVRHHAGVMTIQSSAIGIRLLLGVAFDHLSLHTIRGKNVTMNVDYTVALRVDTEYVGGYIFTSRPIELNEKVVLQVLSILPAYQGGLAFGLTCCDPIHLRPDFLPDNSDDLLERSEYWVGIKDVAVKPRVADELAFWVDARGQVHFRKNSSQSRVIMHVDETQKLWMWFDVYGSTHSIRLLGTTSTVWNSSSEPSISAADSNSLNEPTQLPASSTGLRVNLPPPIMPVLRNEPRSVPPNTPVRPPVPQTSSQYRSYARPPITPQKSTYSNRYRSSVPSPDGNHDECTVNCVIYTCGHMCMCYNCACEQWSMKGECPMCRKTITDVIRTYKS